MASRCSLPGQASVDEHVQWDMRAEPGHQKISSMSVAFCRASRLNDKFKIESSQGVHEGTQLHGRRSALQPRDGPLSQVKVFAEISLGQAGLLASTAQDRSQLLFVRAICWIIRHLQIRIYAIAYKLSIYAIAYKYILVGFAYKMIIYAIAY